MSLDIQSLSCPRCGGSFRKSPNQGGYETHTCINCGHTVILENEHSLEKLFALNAFRNEVIKLLKAKFDGGKKERIETWQKKKPEFERYLAQCDESINGEPDPLYAMARAAYLTDGFGEYSDREERTTVEGLYQTAKQYADKNEKAGYVRELIWFYQKKLRNKKRNLLLGVLGCVCAVLVCGVIAGGVLLSGYAPVATDPATGITVSVPNDALSSFDKLSVSVKAEEQPSHSAAYIDAKNALHYETEKFTLFDLSLTDGNKTLSFDGSVTVEIPIPEGYQAGALKIYHVISDREFEEIPSTVSVANHTVSFTTTHFSLYAVAERHPIVIFDTDGAGEIPRQIIERDRLAQRPEDPSKTGYTFGGWTVGGEIWNFDSDTVRVDLTMTARWIPNEYTVTLVTDGGYLSADTLKVPFMGAYRDLPQAVAKQGYTFLGWYTEAEQGNLVTSDSILTVPADQTLYARYQTNTNTVIFRSGDAEGSMEPFEMKTGSVAKLPANKFTKTGYTFLGWSTSPTGDVAYADQASFTMGAEESYTLYALWTINISNLRLDANGGEGAATLLPMSYGATARLPECPFTRSGYTFLGWSDTPAGEILYKDRAEYTMGEKSEYVLYAIWQKKINKLHFEANGGTGSMYYAEAEFDSFLNLPYCGFWREGYTFIGWSTSPSGELMYVNEAEYRMGPDSDYTLYALWRGNENAFYFYANGGEGNMPTDFTVTTGSNKALPKNQFFRNGYTFAGWSTAEYGSVRYTDEAIYELTVAGDVVLFAQWQTVNYTVSFEVNGGNAIADRDYHAETDTFYLPTPVRAGYRFDGWYDNEDLAGYPTEAVPYGSFGNKTFYAKWTPEPYYVSYDTNGGSYVPEKYYTVETPTFNLPTPEKDGYRFDGWFDNEGLNGTALTQIEVGTVGSKFLYAKWSPVTYTVTFHVNGGSATDPIPYTVESVSFHLPTPTKTGYEFAGWYRDSAFLTEEVYYIYNGSHEDLNLYAKWNPIQYRIDFETNGGVWIESLTYTVETETFSLPFARKDGYSFLAWYTNDLLAGSPMEQIPKGSTGNKTLYAKWSNPIEYRISFVTNGGGSLPSIIYDVEQDGISLPTVTKTGYEFGGWYSNNSFSGSPTYYIWGGTTGNKTFYAKWTPITYYVSYDTNGGAPLDQQSYTVEYALTLPTPLRNGYAFLGWYNNYAFQGEPVTEIPVGSVGTKTFFAKWSEPLSYTVRFESNGGSPISNMTYTAESPSFLLPTPTLRYYEFAGWYSNAEFKGAPITTVSYGSWGNLSLYAKWIPADYVITLVENGGNHLNDITYHIETPTFSLPTPTRSGWLFLGWYDNENFEGQRIVSVEKGSTGNRTYYAKWKDITFNISYVPNGGVLSGTYTQQYIWSETLNVTLPTVTYGGVAAAYQPYYHFEGWFEDAALTVPFANDLRENPRPLTLYAKWDKVDATYVGEGNIPTSTITADRVIIDLSAHTGSTNCLKFLTLTDVSELIFIGNSQATYQSLFLTVADYHTTKHLTVQLVNMNVKGNISGGFNRSDLVVELRTVGDSSITAPLGASAILGFDELVLSGTGNLTVIGGEGFYGSNGSNVTIGHNSFPTPGNGTAGDNGVMAIDCSSITVDSEGSITVIGGKGGNGGNGGNVNGVSNSDGQPRLPAGGNGGNGGNGAAPLLLENLRVLSCAELTLRHGDGGNGGKGGKGGDAHEIDDGKPDYGGHGGRGGAGGSGFNGGDGGQGGNGGHSFGRAGGLFNATDYKGVSGDGGNGGRAGDSVTGIVFKNAHAQILPGSIGDVGLKGAIGTLDDNGGVMGISGKPGSDGAPGSTDNTYYFDFVDRFDPQ